MAKPMTRKLHPLKTLPDRLGVSARTVSRWIKLGLLSPLPGTRRITEAEIDRLETWQSTPPTLEERKRGRYRV